MKKQTALERWCLLDTDTEAEMTQTLNGFLAGKIDWFNLRMKALLINIA